ncbi:MAG: nitronate monooxygenase, partial [Deltaproteobacteria bacterium]|nr:nitronate monooxygenase [Deltaproteobacteria bacterium]
MSKKLQPLRIGDLIIDIPLIQGGMGVRVSASSLASAVSNEGALGVIASVGLGEEWPDKSIDYRTRSELGFKKVIRDTQSLTKRPFGVNIMCALTNYDSLVRIADEEGVDAIISGAGLPLALPSLVRNSRTKLLPVISSARAAELVCRSWLRRYDRLPDGIVLEGPLAGGHLGFSMTELECVDELRLSCLLPDVLGVVRVYEETANKPIPVVVAGGVWDGKDIAKMLTLGASGVQMATRFVGTNECDAHHAYKEAFLNANPEDIIVMDSPVKMPIRVIKNAFVEQVWAGEKVPFKCTFHCLKTCKPKEVKYCIAQALINAYRGNLNEGFAVCG